MVPKGTKSNIAKFREKRHQRYLRELVNNGHFDGDVYEKIYPNGSQPGRIYGLPKIHKIKGDGNVSLPLLRPIASSIGTYNYNLAKYLYGLHSPISYR